MSNFGDVGAFHQKFGLPYVGPYCKSCKTRHNGTRYGEPGKQQPGPRDYDEDTLDSLLNFRVLFLQEELDEFTNAAFTNDELDHAGMADALIDLVYVAMGTAHLLGYPWEELWADVQAANMRKERATAADDSRSKRAHKLDVVKPEGWVPPRTEEIMKKAGF